MLYTRSAVGVFSEDLSRLYKQLYGASRIYPCHVAAWSRFGNGDIECIATATYCVDGCRSRTRILHFREHTL